MELGIHIFTIIPGNSELGNFCVDRVHEGWNFVLLTTKAKVPITQSILVLRMYLIEILIMEGRSVKIGKWFTRKGGKGEVLGNDTVHIM